MLIDALARLAAGRGAKQITSDVSDTARPSFEKQGFIAQRRNMIQLDGEWLANTTMVKQLAAPAPDRPAASRLH
jgi:putative acetyltransferase